MEWVFREPEDADWVGRVIKKVYRKAPGALSAAFLATVHQREGRVDPEVVGALLKPSALQYVVNHGKATGMRDRSDTLLLAEVVDRIVHAKYQVALDLVVSRICEVEVAATSNNDWSKASKHALGRKDGLSLSAGVQL